MRREAALLRAILADPEDNAPRLALAARLTERGDPRGEFIRLQCALARRAKHDPRRPGLETRERGLLADHGHAWLGPLADLGLVVVPQCGAVDHVEVDAAGFPERGFFATFRRGFVEHVAADVASFLAHAEVLFRAAPLLRSMSFWKAAGRPLERRAASPTSPS